MKMRKILFVHHCSTIGGGSYCLLNILRALDRTIVEPVVLLKKEGPLSEDINKLGIKVQYYRGITTIPYNRSLFRIKTIITYFSVFFSLPLFVRTIERLKPEIVYLNSVMLYPYLLGIKKCGLKTIIHIREHWPSNEHLYQLSLLQKIVERNADRVIAINKYSASMVYCSTTIIYDWIDFSHRYIEHDLNVFFGEDVTNKKVFLYAGGMSAVKGALEVLQAFSQLKGEEYRLLALGINKRAIVAGARGKVKLLLSKMGWKTYSMRVYDILTSDNRIKTHDALYEIKDIIEKSYCVLSYYTIPHSNLLLAESILLGTPVIAAKTIESLEYSDNGNLAILYSFMDYNDFKKKIALYIQQDASYKQLIDRGKSISFKMFNPEYNISKLLKVIDNI